jgi:hypothetical protein
MRLEVSLRPRPAKERGRLAFALVALLVVAAGVGCTGTVAGQDDDTDTGPGASAGASGGGGSGTGPGAGTAGMATNVVPGGAGSGGSPDVVACGASSTPAAAATARVRRLTRFEIQNTVIDLLGAAAGPLAAGLEADSQASGFSTGDQRGVSAAYVDALKTMSEGLAAQFRKTIAAPAFDAACLTTDAAARTCADKFVRDFGARAFRRPLEAREVTSLLALYDVGRDTGADGDAADRFRAGLEYVVRGALQSSSFIFRTELGPVAPAAAVTKLTPHELASALSYGTIASPPDAPLLAAAAGGKLETAQQIGEQVRRLITSRPDRFKAAAQRFALEWLGIDYGKPAWNKDAAANPLWKPAMKATLEQETQSFLSDWIDGGSSLTTLLTSTTGFVSRDNAPLYGLTSTSPTLQKTALPAAQRAGILTQAGFLGTMAHTDASSPVVRGLAIMSRLLCNTPPPIPANVPPLPPVDKKVATTTRARFQQHTSAAACAACHRVFDPMGMALEGYDAIGQYRTQENGNPVDSSGALVGAGASDGPVSGGVALANTLANSPAVHACFARQVFRHDLGRIDTPADACALAEVTKAYTGKNLDLRELLVALATSPAFATRTAMAPGGP